MADLQESRKKIDEVDRKLLELFEYRMRLSSEVAEYKRSTGMQVFDPVREKEKIEALETLVKDDNNKAAVEDLFTQIMSISRRLQYTMLDSSIHFDFTMVDHIHADQDTKIAFYGETGSYTEQAMLEYFETQVQGIPMDTFDKVMRAVKDGNADYGVLPIENSSTGTLSDIFDLLAEYNNYIIGEHALKIEHHLWGLPGAQLTDIHKVYSHRQGLLQCSGFLKRHPDIKPIEGGSTAGCAKRILTEGDITQAAIASRRAGEAYGLQLLEASIHDEENNTTRFIIISNKRIYCRGAENTSLCFVTPHKSGSLYHMLSHFIYNKINMTRIESRPITGKVFEYRFFVDIEGSLDNAAVKNALYCIGKEALEMKIFGSFLPVK